METAALTLNGEEGTARGLGVECVSGWVSRVGVGPLLL